MPRPRVLPEDHPIWGALDSNTTPSALWGGLSPSQLTIHGRPPPSHCPAPMSTTRLHSYPPTGLRSWGRACSCTQPRSGPSMPGCCWGQALLMKSRWTVSQSPGPKVGTKAGWVSQSPADAAKAKGKTRWRVWNQHRGVFSLHGCASRSLWPLHPTLSMETTV